jgi:osmoprotectant transport system ATP-binding protein
MITLRNLSKSYDNGETFAVREINLEIQSGEMLALVGESGCGKTTTLKMINRLIEPSAGAIEIDGENTLALEPVALRRSIGYVFQQIGLFPHMTVAENIAITPRLLGWSGEKIRNRVTELLQLVELNPVEIRNRFPRELSGGQQQRVGVARALAVAPSVMLMDEPFGALDPLTRAGLQKELTRLHKLMSVTIILVTHDMSEALTLADRVAVMERGKIVRLDTPANILRDPRHPYAKRLLDAPISQMEALGKLMQENGSADKQ